MSPISDGPEPCECCGAPVQVFTWPDTGAIPEPYVLRVFLDMPNDTRVWCELLDHGPALFAQPDAPVLLDVPVQSWTPHTPRRCANRRKALTRLIVQGL